MGKLTSQRRRYLLGGCWLGHEWVKSVKVNGLNVAAFLECDTCGKVAAARPVFSLR